MPLDPTQFRPSAISPETLKFNSELGAQMAAIPDNRGLTAPEIRRRHREGTTWQPARTMLDFAQLDSCLGPAEPVPLRIFVPDRCDGVYLHIHGGGFVFGASDLQDENLWRLAQACNVAVVSVEYRLAPENPYPAGPDDCEAAAVWLVANASDRFGTERLFIGGESAGGNLAAVTILRMRDRHQYMGWVGADLVYGAFEFGGG